MEVCMVARYKMLLSDDLNEAIEKVCEETKSSKDEIFRKAIQLYLAAYEGKKSGKLIGLAYEKEKIETEFIGI
jgi:metal-responsive CopG/Arc/MetJ family transcriptional regulator